MNPDDGRLRPLPRFVYILVTVASFSNFCAFYSLGLITAALLYIPYSFSLTWWMTAGIVTGTLIGGMIGALGGGPIADKIGRRPCHLIGSSLLFLGGIIFTFAPSTLLIIIGRFISGLGIGIITNLANLIIVESVPAEKRGSLSTIPYFFQFIGTMCPFLVGYLIVLSLPEDSLNLAWRLMAASGVIVSIVDLIATSAALPESPRWLLFHSKTLEGLALMEKIYGRENHDRIVKDYREIIAVPQNSGNNASWWEIATISKYRRPVLVGVSLQIIRKLSGNAAVTFYLTLILVESAGLTKSTALLVSMLIYIPDFLVVFGVFRLMDKMGRKLLLFISCAALALSILPMAIILTTEGPATGSMSLEDHKDFILNYLQGYTEAQVMDPSSHGTVDNKIRYIIILSLFFQRCFYSFGLGPIPSIHTAETLPQSVRAKGLGLALFFSWTAAALSTLVFPWALIYLPYGSPYWFFLAFAIIGVPFIFFAVRETANLSIDPVDIVVHRPKPQQPKPNFNLNDDNNNDKFEDVSL